MNQVIKRELHRRAALQALSGLACGLVWPASQAQSQPSAGYPNKPLKITVPFTPAGTTDFVTRLVSIELAKLLGQPVLVDNKPGAGTVIGVDAVAKSVSDGYNLVTVANSFCVNHTLVKNLPYDTLKDLRPVALMGMSEHVLATHPASGLKSVADLQALKTNGRKISYASFGSGTSAHLAGEMLRALLGLTTEQMVHVPYKGQAPALNDVLGGQVTLMFGNWPELRSHITAGKLAALGMATAKRSVYAPTVPTLAEQGVMLESNSWNGVLVPASTPDAVVQKLNATINQALEMPSVKEAFAKGGIASLSGTPAQFASFIQNEIKRYADVIRAANIKAEI